jgi:RHS repeat-associated protein
MGKHSNNTGDIISTPNGGGAVNGMGEKFSPDLFTGTGNFTVPLDLPVGRNDLQPELNLSYSTGNGNGPFGLGWNLSVPGIHRKTSDGVPVYQDKKDTFILSGSEDLVAVDKSDRKTIYRPRAEGIFARIIHHHDTENNFWEVQSKDGIVSFYGTPGTAGSDLAVVADPVNRDHIFSWKLTKTADLFGNCIEYAYERDSMQEGQHNWDQLYLRQISYVDYTNEDGKEQFLVSVDFEYEERPDPFSQYRSGFEVRTRKRCKDIVVRMRTSDEQKIRSYELKYLDESVKEGRLPSAAAPHNGLSLLHQIQTIGHDESHDNQEERQQMLSPLQFDYTRFELEERDFSAIKGDHLPANSLENLDLELVDLFGNGLPDVLEMNGAVRYWRNLGNGRFDRPREMNNAPAGLRLSDPGVQLIDADGNGQTDLLVTKNGLSGYFPIQMDGHWDRKSFQRYRKAPSINMQSPDVRMTDLDGDGVTDAIRSGSTFECFFNDPDKGWHKIKRVERRETEIFPNVNFDDPRVRWADMTGDGLQDIVLIYSGNIMYWPNLGHGNWGARIGMRQSPRFPAKFDPERLLIGDVDGDGLADLIYVDHGKITLWINQSGNGWSEPSEIIGTPGFSSIGSVRLVDLFGTGISGILWSRDANSMNRDHLFFLDFTGGVKPCLLNRIDNNIGAVTCVEYAPSTRFYLEDEKHPQTRWNSKLPFPVQVVSRVEAIDAISGGKLTTEYRYHHGCWDGAEREFRGFGRVDQQDSETIDIYHTSGLHPGSHFEPVERHKFSPPTETRTWFHQGPVGSEYGEWEEPDYTHEYWPGDRQLLDHTGQIKVFLRSYNAMTDGTQSSMNRRIKRHALRSLKGSVLRTELYALDGSSKQTDPYTVTEYAYSLREEAKSDENSVNRNRIFFPHQVVQRTTQWERGDDPMTQFTFTDAYDKFGQPRRLTKTAMPRRETKRKKFSSAATGELDADEINEARILATHTHSKYASPDPGLYMHDRVSQVRIFELTEPPEMDESDPDNLESLLTEQFAAARNIHEQFQKASESEIKLLGHTLNHYDGEAFAGRAAGEAGPYGALTRSEALVFTETELDDAFGERRPDYLGGDASLPEAAPDGLGQSLGYRREQNGGDYHAGYYIDTERNRFDFQQNNTTANRGLVTAVRDPLGHQTTIEPDRFLLFPSRIVDPGGLETNAEYDYRILEPKQVTDPNGNTIHFQYTPLGLLRKQFIEGKNGEGGTAEKPEIEYVYDFLAYFKTRNDQVTRPVFVHTTQRIRHASDNESDETIESREYSDGFGRLIQTRALAEELAFGNSGDDVGLSSNPGEVHGAASGLRIPDRVVVSGWQIFNNKGDVIEEYEPFFGSGWEYQPGAEAKTGQHVTHFYDPRGQLIRSINPDGSEQRVIFGIPDRLETPDDFEPTPWETYRYDQNDLAPLSLKPDDPTETLKGSAPETHYFTPAHAILDGFGRDICHMECHGPEPETDRHITRSSYDLRGNLLTVTDALGREAFKHIYDLLDHELSVHSIDAGLRTSIRDAAGNLTEYRDSKGSIILCQYDNSNRLTHKWGRANDNSPVTLRERLIYGDNESGSGMDHNTARQGNLLGQLFRHYDEAGLVESGNYDFKGNPEEEVRRVISDKALEDRWTADWNGSNAENDLENFGYQTSIRYDALNRPLNITYPEDANGHRAVLSPHYNRAGNLEKVDLDNETYVARIAYNAKGQRSLIAYGNSIMTRYLYNPNTYRLERLRTEKFEGKSADKFVGKGPPLQEFTYSYDLAGNIISIEDRTPHSGIVNTLHGKDRLVRSFTYDPLYRLKKATGRACIDNIFTAPPDKSVRCGTFRKPYQNGGPTPSQRNAPELTAAYTQHYEYDPAGNLLELHLTVGDRASKRLLTTGAHSNRLDSAEYGNSKHNFEYDTNGNLTRENTERHYTWDHSDRLIDFKNRPEGSDHTSVEARYLYGADGLRVKKYIRKTGNEKGRSTVYVGDIFEHHTWKENGAQKENNHLHVMDGRQRIALIRRGPAHPGDAGPPVQFNLGDHLGSSHTVLDDSGNWINREEHFPYGETSFGSFAKKRYRFTGKELDEESGLYYHGARYYAAWLGRWVSCDPAGMLDGTNLYAYVHNNPVNVKDPDGRESEHWEYQPGEAPRGPGQEEAAREYFEGLHQVRVTEIWWDPETMDPVKNEPGLWRYRTAAGHGGDETEANLTEVSTGSGPDSGGAFNDMMRESIKILSDKIGNEIVEGALAGARDLAGNDMYDDAAMRRHAKLSAGGKILQGISRGLTAYDLWNAHERWNAATNDAERSRAALDAAWAGVPGPLGWAGSIGNIIGQELSKVQILGRTVDDYVVDYIAYKHRKLKLIAKGIEMIGDAVKDTASYVRDKANEVVWKVTEFVRWTQFR